MGYLETFPLETGGSQKGVSTYAMGGRSMLRVRAVMGVLYHRTGIEKNGRSLSLRRNQLSIKCVICNYIQ